MIYTSYFRNLKNIPRHIVRISICEKSPEWYRGLHYNKLAPKRQLYREWKLIHDDQYYMNNFWNQVLSRLDVDDVYHELMALSKNNDIVLLCYERPYNFSHRQIVLEWLNAGGYRTEEWDNKCKNYGSDGV